MKLLQGQKWLMIGDSVTDCGRVRPIGEPIGGLGTGYPSIVSSILSAWHPELRIRVVNVGISGNTSRDLAKRWQTDVIDQYPDWLSILIGVNDIWRQFDCPLQPEWGVQIGEYESILDKLCTDTKPLLKGGLILMTPFFVEPNHSDLFRAKIDAYGEVIKRLSKKHDAILADSQLALDKSLAQSNGLYSSFFAGDRVHPNLNGHMVVARCLLDAVGLDWTKRP